MYKFLDGCPRISYSIVGKGLPLIFLHGIGGNSLNWQDQQKYFSKNFTTIAWNARGYSLSEDYTGPLKFSDFSKDLLRLIDSLNIKKAHFVGLSMGARILMDFYSNNKIRIASLTLCDCYYSFKNFLNPKERKKYIEIRQKPLLEGKSLTDLAPEIIKSLVSPNCSESVRKKIYESLSTIRKESYLKTIKEATNYDVTHQLSSFTVPVQLIYGEDDKLTPPSLGLEIKNKINGSKLSIIKDAGHLPNIEQPKKFNDVLEEFLSQYKNCAEYYGKT
ncbi:MAG: alpha/beta hydrolase [Pelagibacterales bacterium]|nr:alpha/beta hydrolase [Pelagibacterales bacterium]|tara:strand:+ start:4570 stop:5394 length:825 start_codon:yes stop_codon:yes gene_type:complete